MTKIVDITKHMNKEPQILGVEDDENREYDRLYAALSSAMHSLKEARWRPEYEKTHLLNCRDALDRASFYLNDEIDEGLGSDDQD